MHCKRSANAGVNKWMNEHWPGAHVLTMVSGINTRIGRPAATGLCCSYVCVNGCVTVCVSARLQLLPASDLITYKQAYADLAESAFQHSSFHHFPNSFDLAKPKNKTKLPLPSHQSSAQPVFVAQCPAQAVRSGCLRCISRAYQSAFSFPTSSCPHHSFLPASP